MAQTKAPKRNRHLMSLRIGIATLLLLGVAGPNPATARPIDWVMVLVTVGEQGASGVTVDLRGEGEATGAGPMAAGSGLGWGEHSDVEVTSLGGTGVSLTTSKDLGSFSMDIEQAWSDRFTFRLSLWMDLSIAAGDRIALLGFFPNAAITVDVATVEVATGGVSSTVKTGRGSQAVWVVDPRESDTAVGVGPAGAAIDLSRSRSVDFGMVGAFNLLTCEAYCQGSWEVGSRSGEYTQVHPHAVYGAGVRLGSEWFAGPKGTWHWRWTGSALADEEPTGSLFAHPLIFAWAPIGKDHRLFKLSQPAELVPLP